MDINPQIIDSNMTLNILKNSSLRRQERKKESIANRLYKNIYKNPLNGCWEWTDSKSKQGHGRIGYRDKVYLTHRLSYEISIGEIPDGKNVCHKCDNPPCINPEHLFVGTQKDNISDMVSKGRGFQLPPMPGEINHLAKLSNEDAKIIREKLKNGATGISLAKEYRISVSGISKIKLGKSYK
jgi:hypothetical protein